jgi:hypothetical protein
MLKNCGHPIVGDCCESWFRFLEPILADAYTILGHVAASNLPPQHRRGKPLVETCSIAALAIAGPAPSADFRSAVDPAVIGH